jgi:branched-chain amino acid transport system permease protein
MVGINVNRVFAAAFGLGAGLAGVGGVLLITQTPATPDVTFSVLLPAFVVVTLGGFGSLIGVIVGAMLFGVIQSVSTVAFGIGWSPIAALVALVIVLLIRPAGLLGSRFYVA